MCSLNSLNRDLEWRNHELLLFLSFIDFLFFLIRDFFFHVKFLYFRFFWYTVLISVVRIFG